MQLADVGDEGNLVGAVLRGDVVLDVVGVNGLGGLLRGLFLGGLLSGGLALGGGGLFALGGRGFALLGGGLAAAGGEREDHHESEKQSKKLLHSGMYPPFHNMIRVARCVSPRRETLYHSCMYHSSKIHEKFPPASGRGELPAARPRAGDAGTLGPCDPILRGFFCLRQKKPLRLQRKALLVRIDR